MSADLARWVIRWRYLVMAATVAFVAVVGSGIRLLEFDADYRVWFSKENPQLQAFESIQKTYTQYDNVLFVVAPKDGQVFTPQTLAAIEWLTQQAWQIPCSRRVDSIANFQHSHAEGDEIVVADLYVDAAHLSAEQSSRIRDIALNEPLLRNRLVSDKGHVAGVNVTIQSKGDRNPREVPEIVRASRDLAARLVEKFPQVEVHLTGIVMMNHAFPEASRHDMETLVPIMFALVALILAVVTRSVIGTIGTILVIAFSILVAMGTAGWAGVRMTGASASAPIIILTLAVADSVHLLVVYVHRMRLGDDQRAALSDSLRINFQPIMVTSVTTAIGFLSMNLGDVPPFRDLGNIVALGVLAAFVLSVTFLVAFVASFPAHVSGSATPHHRAMESIAEFVIRRRAALLWLLGPAFAVIIAFIPNNEFNDEFVKYFDQRIEFRRATDFTTENLTGMYTVHMSLESGQEGGIADPEYLRTLDEFANWFRSQPEVVHVNTITDTLRRLNMNMHGDDPAMYRLPQSRELAAQILLLYEMSLPYGLDLNDQLNVDKSAVRMVVSIESLSTRQTLDLDRRASEWLARNAPASMRESHGSSPNIMFAHIAERNVRSMLWGTTLALLLISLTLVVALNSLRLGLLSLIPNLVPLGLTFGLWGLLVGRVGLATSVVSAMTLGIIVDDTVHFLSKYARARQEQDMSAEDSVRYAFATVGTALWVTSLVLIVGFAVLAQSAFEVNAGMGELAAITIAIALLADFLFLPPLLMYFEEKSRSAVLSQTFQRWN